MSRAPRPRFPVPVLIETSAALATLVARLRTEPYVTVDTEFMRERTFWPELCVVQLGGAEEVAVIDALATDLDLAPLGELFADQNVLKVFHAARQDIEICVLRWGAVPTPLFDTQVAGMVAGFGDQAGYDTLVQQLTGGQIDKAHRFSDWSARPLSPAQLAYAAADVTWLRLVYERLRERLEADRRLEWVTQEMAILTDPATYRTEPEDAWQRLRPRSTNRRFLGMVRALAAWREREAQRINIPRQRVLKDETLLELAATAPDTPEGLARARGITRGFAEGRGGTALLEAIAAARDEPEDALPPALRGPESSERPSPALVALLKVLLAACCERHHVAPKLVALSDDLDRLAIGQDEGLSVLQGWRRTVFGAEALALREGHIALGVAGREVRVIPIGAAERP